MGSMIHIKLMHQVLPWLQQEPLHSQVTAQCQQQA